MRPRLQAQVPSAVRLAAADKFDSWLDGAAAQKAAKERRVRGCESCSDTMVTLVTAVVVAVVILAFVLRLASSNGDGSQPQLEPERLYEGR